MMLAHLLISFVMASPFGGIPVIVMVPYPTVEACKASAKAGVQTIVSVPFPSRVIDFECVDEPLPTAGKPA